MPLRDVFRDLFRDPAAERELASLGGHIVVPAFNLSTTSLRHIRRWYDRLQEIADGIHRDHPNFYSDPESLGLVERVSSGARLTRAGNLFLATATSSRNQPARAEFELIKILYYLGLRHRRTVEEFINAKRQNLLRFLIDCHLTSNSDKLLESPKLLAIAEALPRFPGALHHFLELSSNDLSALESLGEAGFSTLWPEARPPIGLSRLARKIGGDYTRAEDRRLHFLMSMVLNEIRQDLSRRGRLFDELRVPHPFSNIVSAASLLKMHAAYTDEIRVAQEEGQVLVFLNPELIPAPTAPVVRIIGTRVPGRHTGRRASTTTVRQPTERRRVIDVVLAKEAEDYLERVILKPKHRGRLVRVGHTSREFVLLSDGSTPGADFYVTDRNSDAEVCFYEAKSALNTAPSSIRLTRAEYTRAKKCHAGGIPYEIYIVVFRPSTLVPEVLCIPDFAARAAELSLDEAVSFEISLDR